jgi:hypothetical protein
VKKQQAVTARNYPVELARDDFQSEYHFAFENSSEEGGIVNTELL